MKRPARAPSQLSEALSHRLNAYALAASAAGVGALALTQPAEAKIIYTPAHIVLHAGERYYIDLNHDGKPDFYLWNFSCRTVPCSASTGTSAGAFAAEGHFPPAHNYISASNTFSDEGTALALKKGARIPPCQASLEAPGCSAPAASHAGMAAWWNRAYHGNWAPDVKNRYLGLTFQINGRKHYGWARVSVKITLHPLLITGTLTGYAYETIANKPIVAGKTCGPDVITVEPATLGRLAAGQRGPDQEGRRNLDGGILK